MPGKETGSVADRDRMGWDSAVFLPEIFHDGNGVCVFIFS